MTGAAGPGPALGRGDAGLAQPHHGVTLPLPVHPAWSTQTQARPKPMFFGRFFCLCRTFQDWTQHLDWTGTLFWGYVSFLAF